MDTWLRGHLENLTDEYIERISGVDKGIQKTQELLDEYNISDKSTNTKDLLMGYHLGRMLQYAISTLPPRDEKSKVWTPEDIWSIIQSKLAKLSEKIEMELSR
jgi:hypothetical protein